MENVYNESQTAEMVEVFCRYIWKNGKRIYPKKSKVFHFWIYKPPGPRVNR